MHLSSESGWASGGRLRLRMWPIPVPAALWPLLGQKPLQLHNLDQQHMAATWPPEAGQDRDCANPMHDRRTGPHLSPASVVYMTATWPPEAGQDRDYANSNAWLKDRASFVTSISGLVAEYIVAIDVTRVRFPADAFVVQTPHTPTTL